MNLNPDDRAGGFEVPRTCRESFDGLVKPETRRDRELSRSHGKRDISGVPIVRHHGDTQ